MDEPFGATLDAGASFGSRTAAWRTMRPVFAERAPPCNPACPAGGDVRQWVLHAARGDFEPAWRALVRDNPLPALVGRVCDRPCESACNRAALGGAVDIGRIERFLGDEALRRGWAFEPPAKASGRRVLVVGAQAPGLSAAYQLRRLGHAVKIVGGDDETHGAAQGAPRAVIDGEIARIAACGVEIESSRPIADIRAQMREGRFDAALLAQGPSFDASLARGVPGVSVADGAVAVGPDMMTGYAGLFAVTVAPGASGVAAAVGLGRAAARRIDEWLAGKACETSPQAPLARFDALNPWYYDDAPGRARGELDATGAIGEARRCLSCGACFECDNCYAFCPDGAVVKLGSGKGYRFNYDHCKGCGICVSECPCGAITTVPETT